MTLTTEAMQEIYEAAVHVEATLGDPDAEFDLYCKLDDVGGVEATIRKLIDMLRAANREAQPVGFISAKHGPVLYGEHIGLPASTHLYTATRAPAVPDDYFGELVKKARSAADKAMCKHPQPNYVLNKVAEESGEVIKAVIHYTEGREEWANVEGEIIDNLAMLIRLVVEGDQVIGFTPPDACRAVMLAQPQNEPQIIPNNILGELVAAVNRLFECDGTRGQFSAIKCSDAREEIERLLTLPVNQGYKLNSPEIQDGWIACTEQTPNADGAYWCWFGKEEQSVIQQRVCIWINRNNEWCDSAVTHWMPLPAAPKQGEKQ